MGGGKGEGKERKRRGKGEYTGSGGYAVYQHLQPKYLIQQLTLTKLVMQRTCSLLHQLIN